jgi:hypothetical protein
MEEIMIKTKLQAVSEDKLDIIDQFRNYLMTVKAIPEAMPLKAEEKFKADLESIGITDSDTQEKIGRFFRKYFRSAGVTSTRERAEAILIQAYKIPFDTLISNNPEIEYQGAGQALRTGDNEQVITLKGLGKFELMAVSSHRDKPKKAAVKFRPTRTIKAEVAAKVKVV